MKSLATFDWEVLPNVFIACIKPLGKPILTFEISPRKNEFKELVAMLEGGAYIFVGYNCSGYDTPIANMLLADKYKYMYGNYLDIADAAFKMSGLIINNKNKDRLPDPFVRKHMYSNYFAQIDLMTLMASSKLRVGLKALQVTMCMPNVKEMLVDWTKYLRKEEIDPIIHYCHNDINSTETLLRFLKPDLHLRKVVEKEFGLTCMSKDGVGVGVDIFRKFICEEMKIDPRRLKSLVDVNNVIAVKELVLKNVKFKTKTFQNLLDWYNSIVINLEEYELLTDDDKEEKYRFVVKCNNLAHGYGLGGLHSLNDPMPYVADDEYYLSDRDVESYYPSLAIKKMFGPKGMLKAFINTLQGLKDKRVAAKLVKDKVKDTAYKLSLNSILGNLKNKHSEFYDPAANMAIAINGQLYLSMLIETCELEGIECISSNTDGATFRVKRTDKGKFDKICDDWSEETEMKLEEVLYEKMIILGVNSYLAFKEGYSDHKHEIYFHTPEESVSFNFSQLKLQDDPVNKLRNTYVKEKGLFITNPVLGKGMDTLIIAKALQNYFGKGIPVEDTVRDFKSIHDYVKMQKVGRQYNVEYNGLPQQHINRFVVSKNAPYLMKWKMKPKKVKVGKEMVVVKDKLTGEPILEKSYANLLKGEGVLLVNEVTDESRDLNINYQYYINKCNKVIQQVYPSSTQTSLF